MRSKKVPSERFEEQFQLQLKEYKAANEAWNGLKGAGCETTFLLMYLDLCTRSPKDFWQRRKKLAKKAEGIANRLSQDATDIQDLISEPEIGQELVWYMRAQDFRLTRDLDPYVSWLRTAANNIRSRYRQRDAQGQLLRFLADYIRGVMDEDRFADIAELLQAAHAAQGITNKDVSPDSVRNKVSRARQRMARRKFLLRVSYSPSLKR
jgi:hypothetical protein